MDSDSFFSKYDRLIYDTISTHHIPGVSVAVVHGNSTWIKSYGIARYPEEKVTATTLFNAASMSKAFIAAAISLLVDESSSSVAYRDVKWSTPVSQLLPDFVLSNSRSTEMVTIEDILSHRSGCPDLDDACMGIHAKIPDTPESVTRKLRYLPLTAPVRSRYQYCNVMYVVAVHLLETLTRQQVTDFLRKRIWEPLGMEETYFGLSDIVENGAVDRLAKGYGWDNDNKTYFEIPWPVQPEGAGAGEIHSTAGDYARFLRCMIDKAAPFSSTGHDELVKPRTITGDTPKPFHSPELYALGWSTETYHGEVVISHGGATNGFGCQMVYLPARKWGMVIFGNAIPTVAAHERICWTMIDDLLSIPTEKRLDWDEQFTKEEKEEEEEARKSVEDLYPTVPKPPIPPSLPLASYVGKYQSDGWGTLIVECKGEKLIIDATDRSWRFKLSLTHVSGEFFAAEKVDIETLYKVMIKVEFRLGPEGVVSILGIDFVTELDDFIWFKKVS